MPTPTLRILLVLDEIECTFGNDDFRHVTNTRTYSPVVVVGGGGGGGGGAFECICNLQRSQLDI